MDASVVEMPSRPGSDRETEKAAAPASIALMYLLRKLPSAHTIKAVRPEPQATPPDRSSRLFNSSGSLVTGGAG